MKREFQGYRRLARGAFSCSSLWAGGEHLLYVKGTGLLVPIVEEYRRLRYRDIQAVSWAPTAWSRWAVAGSVFGAVVCAVPVALASATLARASAELPGTVALAVMTLVATAPFLLASLVVLGWNLVRGRSAVFAIQTPGAVFLIRPANRLRVARALATELAPLVEAHQRDLPSASGRPPEVPAVPPPPPTAEGAPPAVPPSAPAEGAPPAVPAVPPSSVPPPARDSGGAGVGASPNPPDRSKES